MSIKNLVPLGCLKQTTSRLCSKSNRVSRDKVFDMLLYKKLLSRNIMVGVHVTQMKEKDAVQDIFCEK